MQSPRPPAPALSSPRARKLRSLQTAESLAMLQEPLVLSHAVASDSGDTSVVLHLSPRHGRIATLVGVSLTIVVALTLVFAGGAEVQRLARGELSASELEKLLERYNSYSGTVAAAVARPLELFVSLVVQVVVLCLMAESVLAFQASWRVKAAVVVLGAGIGFLLTNGLNALNVNKRELPATLVMTTSDLLEHANGSRVAATSAPLAAEMTPLNPSTNTILRSLILGQASKRTPKCTRVFGFMLDDSVDFGMPQRAWMGDLLPRAVSPSTMRFDLMSNATTAKADEFPMDASTAADLALIGLYTGSKYAPFTTYSPFDIDNRTAKTSFPTSATRPEREEPTARLVGLLPPDVESTEAQDRAWFLRHGPAFVRSATSLDMADGGSAERYTMELSRVNLTSSVWMEALTLERQVIPSIVPVYKAGGARFYPQEVTASLAEYTFITKSKFDDSVDAAAEGIHAFAVCLNSNGTEILHSTLHYKERGGLVNTPGVCANTSATSMYVFATSKRLEADALFEKETNVTGNPDTFGFSGSYIGTYDTVVKNVRVVYSTTFARIRWRLENLSEVYNAQCLDSDGCMGLHANLSGGGQRLLVGATGLPMDQLSPVPIDKLQEFILPLRPHLLTTVRRPVINDAVKEPSGEYDFMLGDLLLHHNIRNVSLPTKNVSGEACAVSLENRGQLIRDNHLYMETTLQPMYTAAAFFLFQAGVARDVLPSPPLLASSRGVSLALDGNVNELSIRVSIPLPNAILSIVGCGLLVAVVAWALVGIHRRSPDDSPLRNITTPHVVARVMVDDTTFPSLALQRHIIHQDLEGEADRFLIESLALRPAIENPTDGHRHA